MFRHLAPLALLLAAPALAEAPSLQQQQVVEIELAKAPKGTRFGLLVVDDANVVIAAINPDQRFIPASNTKMFTTAAAYALQPGMDQPDEAGGTQVALRAGRRSGVPNVWLAGRGDARLSAAADCKIDCLAALADAVAAKVRTVGDVWGDDTFFPDQRWSPGMSWNNIGSNDAAAASALSLDGNELLVSVVPGAMGQPPAISAPAYVSIENDAQTVESGKTRLVLEHGVNSRDFRLYGTIAVDGTEWRDRIGIDDGAHYAAWTLAEMLKARGVTVSGTVRVLHRPVEPWDDPAWRAAAIPPITFGPQPVRNVQNRPAPVIATPIPAGIDAGRVVPAKPLARLTRPPLAEDVSIINKDSQNHHAELLLRLIGSATGLGSLEDGLAAERALFERAGIPREGYDLSDGSGMSTYNRVSPRAVVALLRWIDAQPWGKAWYASLPVAGVDGTLMRRFLGTPLAGNLAAKTGTLNATNALSGTFRAASGRRLTFSFIANDVPDGQSAIPAMEAVMAVLYAAN